MVSQRVAGSPKAGKVLRGLRLESPGDTQQKNFRIGAPIYDDGLTLRGVLDEVFVFKRALTQVEVTTVMEKGLVGAQTVEVKNKLATVWGQIKSQS